MQENLLIPYHASPILKATAVVVIAPHPDDEVFGCGGAIIKHRAAQTPVHVITLTNGEAQGDAPARQKESLDAAEILGISSSHFWNLTDRQVVNSAELQKKLIEFIQAHDADLIYCPAPSELHPDHRASADLCQYAILSLGRPCRIAFYEVSAPLQTNFLLDITDIWPIKENACSCYVSQLKSQSYLEQIKGLNRYRSYTLGQACQYAEAYRVLDQKSLPDRGSRQAYFESNQGDLPLVSIMIRSIDRPTLNQALSSIAAQSYPNIEVIVVDACGDHRALPLFSGSHPVRLITKSEPLHRSYAANLALDVARGKFLLFLDDDDWLMPDHIQRLVKNLLQSPQHLAAYTGVACVNEQNQPTGEVFDWSYDLTRHLSGNLMPIHAVLFNQQLITRGCRFDTTLNHYEDWDFWLQIAQHTLFIHIPGISAVYRIYDSSGVHEANTQETARKIIFEKWQHKVNALSLSGLMHKVWINDQLEARILELEKELAEKKKNNLQTVLKSYPFFIGNRNFARLIKRRLIKVIQLGWRFLRWYPKNYFRAKLLLKPIWLAYLKNGWRELPLALRHFSDPDTPVLTYTQWCERYEPTPKDWVKMQAIMKDWQYQPMISIIMPTFNPKLEYLKAAIESVRQQLYPNWELCIADDASTDSDILDYLTQLSQSDPRIKVYLRTHNGHISVASNTAIEMAEGKYIALLDQDDLLAVTALWFIVERLQQEPNAVILYSDEDKINELGQRVQPYFKCDYNRELMWSQNMISHLGCYAISSVKAVGGFRTGYEGSQDYDLALRIIECISVRQIQHIPRILYHWRISENSTAYQLASKPYALETGKKALQEHLDRQHIPGMVMKHPEHAQFYRVALRCPEPKPKVSILIPTRDQAAVLKKCLDSLFNLTHYSNYEVILINNDSQEKTTLELFESYPTRPLHVVHDPRPFNYSALNNTALVYASGEYICLMNNDIEIINPNWLEEMLSFASLPDIGAVGTRLWYAEKQIQHAGVILGIGGAAQHSFVGLKRHEYGYFGRAILHQSYSAVTAACLLVKKERYREVGGLDENYSVAFNDVDFCLKLNQAGYHNVWTPFAEMIHHESLSRGKEDTPIKRARERNEIKRLNQYWPNYLLNDPAYSPNLSLAKANFQLAVPPRIKLHF